MAAVARQPIWMELGLKVLYGAGIAANLSGVAMQSSLLRRIAVPACPSLLALLLIQWHRRVGWANVPYACCVLIGLLLNLLGDLVMSEPRDDDLAYAGFSLFMCALFCFTAALSLPSSARPDEVNSFIRLLDTSTLRMREHSRTAHQDAPVVPLRPSRGLALVCLIAAGMLMWRIVGGVAVATDPRYAVTACLVITQAILIWRALARIGYAAPLVSVSGLLRARRRRRALLGMSEDETLRPAEASRRSLRFDGGAEEEEEEDGEAFRDSAFAYTDEEEEEDEEDTWGGPGFGSLLVGRGRNGLSLKRASRRMRQQRRERNQRLATEEAAALESRWYQWCGVLGCVLLSLALLALGYDQFWEDDDMSSNAYATAAASELTYAYSLLSWAGQTLLVASVPCHLPPVVDMDDPVVCPPPIEGAPLRIGILLPNEDFDIAEVAVPWYVLHRRGHTLVFITRDGLPGVQVTGRMPLPLDTSAHGYGCASSGCGSEASCGCCQGSATRSSGRVHALRQGLMSRVFGACCCSSRQASRTNSCSRSCALLRRALCCGDACSASSVAVGVGAPGPLVVAMYREMIDSEAFRCPLAWSRSSIETSAKRLPRRQRRRSGRDGSRRSRSATGGDAGEEGAGEAVLAMLAENLAAPESLDGLLVVGAYPAAQQRILWDDEELQEMVARFWNTGRPLGMFGNAPLVLARTVDEDTGASALADVLTTATPNWMERVHAALAAVLNCRCYAVSTRATHVSTQAELMTLIGTKFVPGPSPFSCGSVMQALVHNDSNILRVPWPHDDFGTVVVEDGCFISAQCGGDAFLLTRRFMSKLEEVQRAF